jgi:PhzF family phenazine biosynthesis protein
MLRRFQQVDVFSPDPLSGNPLAVVLDSDGLSTEEMQRFTRWMNLSETTFLVPTATPDADYRVRIFTLSHELPFAGHPTLGSCHAWLTAGGKPRRDDEIVQECGIGLVRIRRADGSLSFAAPPLLRSGPVDDALLDQIAGVLRIDRADVVDAEWADNGPGWVVVVLDSADAVLALEPAAASSDRLDIGVVGRYPDGSECAYELRAIFSDGLGGLQEDPVTGSLHAAVAQWLLSTGRATAPYTASQGARLGRTGRAHIDQDERGTVWVGGSTRTYIEGTVDL